MASSVFPLMVGIYRWKKIDKPLRYFIFFLIITVIQIGIEYILGRLSIPTHLLSDFYIAFEVTFFLSLFRLFIRTQMKKMILLAFILIEIVILIFSTVYYIDTPQFNTIIGFSSRFILIISALLLIHTLVTNNVSTFQPLHEHYVFWIATGVLIYCSGSIIVLSLGNEIMNLGIDYFFAMWYINWSFFIIANILYSRSFFVEVR